MKIEKVQQPIYNLSFEDKEREILKDIFGNMSDFHLKALCGDAQYSRFVLDFYNLLDNV